MKKRNVLLGTLLFSMNAVWSQVNSELRIPLIGSTAPSFTAQSTKGEITFPGESVRTWKVLFSHPRDFTPVCSSELLELAQKQDDFKKLGVQIFVLSTDALDQHKAWVNSLNTVSYKDRSPVDIDFPLIDDQNKKISLLYGMLHEGASTTRTVRGVFIVDPNDKIRSVSFYPMEVGRNLDEIERTIIAMQTADKQHVLTPANWRPGDDVFLPYAENKASKDNNTYYITPFMLAKKIQ
jgi:peroxiredoxin (alkyl hydroperoxide reductase subunit C)